MNPCTIYHLCRSSFSFYQEKLVPLIVETAQPDRVYLLGGSLYRRRSESIFNTSAPASNYTSDYYLLILIRDLGDKALYEWEDIIESRCKPIMPVTTIILQTNTFEQWLQNGHSFAQHVHQLAVPIYDAGNLSLETTKAIECGDEKELKNIYTIGLEKAQEFLAGSEMFRIRKQNALAAFALHQSAEQALSTLLKIGTGYHRRTHNLKRLISLAGMVSCKLQDIFPQRSEQDKRLFNLLQGAYSDARYKKDYKIGTNDLLYLTERVKEIHRVLVEFGKGKFSSYKG